MADLLVVKSAIKDVAGECNVSSDFADALHDVAVAHVKAAAKRADANGRKTIQSKDVFCGKLTAKVMLVVKSKVKEVKEAAKFNVSSDFADALNELLIVAVKQACLRAEENGRKTIGARDL